MKRGRLLAASAIAGVAVWSWMSLDIQAARLGEAPRALLRLLRDAWPPVTGPDNEFLHQVLDGLLETLQMAFLATILGSLLALPLALIAARNLAPWPLVAVARVLSAALRVLPSLVWAIVAVLVLGFGPLAGVAAMTLYTVGFLAKLQYEALEGVPRDALDAARAMGATRFQQAWHVAIPEAGNAMRSQILFMLDYNIRASSIIGYVGAGGLGELLYIHFRFYNYDHVLTILLVMFATVAALDLVSLWVRRRFIEVSEDARPRSASWADVLLGPLRRPKD